MCNVQADLYDGSWIVSLYSIGSVVGSPLGGVLNQLVGPRVALLLSTPLAAATWVATALAPRLWVIYAARIAAGLVNGIFIANMNVYMAEISHPDWRGTLASIVGVNFALGKICHKPCKSPYTEKISET